MDLINEVKGEEVAQINDVSNNTQPVISTKKKILSGLFNFVVVPILCIIFIIASAILVVFIPSHGPSIILGFRSESISLNNNAENNEKEIISLKRDIDKIDKKLTAFVPTSFYLIINSTANRFYLYNGSKLVKSDRCSTGSYIKLKNENKNKEWIFRTPKGVFTIKNKIKDPVWTKPDWAFEEEGLPIPSAHHESRYEHGVLGDYALHLGDGYMIHGTLYQRLLGMPVTHGCIRLDDKNLELIYNSLKKGSKVYIF
jgi:L,D-transpeptidase ErfK/SrfK